MRIRHALFLAPLLALVFPSVAQNDDAKTFFSLGSNRSFGINEKPTVQLWAQNLDRLQFRVYRVNDPVKFFEQLQEPHQFGGRAPEPPRRLTPIERFHQWKARTRAWIRNAVRRQYTADSRELVRNWAAERAQRAVPRTAHATEYAGVPVLNPDQVVLVFEQAVSRRERWNAQTVPIGVDRRGLYLVEATDGNLRAYTVVSVTGLAVITKGSPGRVMSRVVSRGSGTGVADCPVILFAGKKEIARLRTDRAGMIDVKLEDAKPENVIVMATRKEDFAVDAMNGWSLGNDPDRDVRVYVYTDRPVYRPGHTVHFRGILRAQSGTGYSMLARKQVDFEVQDPEGKTLTRGTLPVSAVGTVQGEYTLPANAALGFHMVNLHSGEEVMGAGFEVQEYRKPEYEVKVAPEKKRVLQGEEMSATIEARYYYGEPVANARVSYVVHKAQYWNPYWPQDEESDGEQEDGESRYDAGAQILEEKGQLDAQGKLTIKFPTEVGDHDSRYRIEARVTDAANREIAGSVTALATIGSYFVFIEPERYVYSPGDRARLIAHARDYDGNPVAVPFRVELLENHWDRTPHEGPVFASAAGRTDATGSGAVELPLSRGGSVLARLKSQTPEGREVSAVSYLWINAGAAFYGAARQRIQIVTDKKSYRTGEVAKVLIVTGVPNTHLWVTTEGLQVHTSRLVDAADPAVTLDVPILPEYAPNFFVNAVFIHDQQMFQGTKSVRVPPVEKQLTVNVKTSSPRYRPGESGTITVEARDHAGRPVAAEFSLGMVDEAIYAIRRDTTPDILSFFYGRSYNRVSTASSLTYYFHGEAGKRQMQLARVRPPWARAQIKPERLVEPRIRKLFPDTMFWVADLKTGADGTGKARVDFPDALTTWRATARGVTGDTKVGSAIERTVVRKDLMLRLGTPRFLTEGDQVTVPAIVQNYLETAKQVRVTLAAEGVDVLDPGPRDISVPSRGQARVDFRMKARPVRKAVLTGKALTDEESDGLEIELPVLPFGVKQSEARAGTLDGASDQAEFELKFPADAAPGSRGIEITLSPSIAGTILGALDYLTSFPYGCTEQTMSSFLPNVIVAQAAKELGIKTGIDQEALDKKIRAGLERLEDYQHEDGGWGWWKTDESAHFMTAYVISGLQMAAKAGVSVKPEMPGKGRKWLEGEWPRLNRVVPDLRAYVAWALAITGSDKSRPEQVWGERSSLSPYGLALLGLALQESGDGRAAEIAGLLERTARQEGDAAYWQLNDDPLLGIHCGVSSEVTAYAVKFLARQTPQSPLLPKAARYLAEQRDQGEYWGSTKQTAMVVFGLLDYLKVTRELQPDYSVALSVNGPATAMRRFTAADAVAPSPAVVKLSAENLGPANSIRIRKTGTGRLYWSARSDWYATSGKLARTGGIGLSVLRDYYRLMPEQVNGRIVYRLDALSGPVSTGDVLAVRLTLTGGNWSYLMLEDPFPAGAEFIERDDLFELKEKPSWWSGGYTRREFHDDRAAFFRTYFSRGQEQWFYLLKVTNAGQFRVSPARVQPMYQPQYFATSDSVAMEVK